ncbi:hypothetical protein BGW39_004554, partial [Mortierella sp. 14UC]
MRSVSANQTASSRGFVQQSVPAAVTNLASRRGSVDQIHVGSQNTVQQHNAHTNDDGDDGGRLFDIDILQRTGNLIDARHGQQLPQNSSSRQGSVFPEVLGQTGSSTHRTFLGAAGRSSSAPNGGSGIQGSQGQVPSYLDGVGQEYWNMTTDERAVVDDILKANYAEKIRRL